MLDGSTTSSHVRIHPRSTGGAQELMWLIRPVEPGQNVHGPRSVLEWFHAAWTKHGKNMWKKWIKYGSYMENIWNIYGNYVDKINDIWKIYLKQVWTIHGT